jgi:hypothetical protein
VANWIKAQGNQRVAKNNMPWDEVTILPGDTFEVHSRQRGGAGPRKSRDQFTGKNHNPRMARRKRIEALSRELREKQKAEDELEETLKWRSTSVIYDGHEFVTRMFINDEWSKHTVRHFSKWVRSFSGLEREWQKLIDQGTNSEFTEIRGKSLILLNPDEVWESGQVMLKRRTRKKGI